MDGAHWNDDENYGTKSNGTKSNGTRFNEMLVFPSISPCRGRPSKPNAGPVTSFTLKQLDAAAPLSRSNILSLRLSNPNANTKRMLQRRIEEAFNLKYRNGEDEPC